MALSGISAVLGDAEILREKGTNRSRFFRGEIDKYTWVHYGSSYLPSDMNAAYLYAQLLAVNKIQKKRMQIWNTYHEGLKDLEEKGKLQRPFIPDYARHNAHMYYVKVENLKVRTRLLQDLMNRGVHCVFHYIPLHTSPAGQKYGRFSGEDVYTTKESERLVRLPMFYNLEMDDVGKVIDAFHQLL